MSSISLSLDAIESCFAASDWDAIARGGSMRDCALVSISLTRTQDLNRRIKRSSTVDCNTAHSTLETSDRICLAEGKREDPSMMYRKADEYVDDCSCHFASTAIRVTTDTR